jgi:hypothetical protein
LTPRALAGRVWGNIGALPGAVGRAVSGWAAPSWLALPLALLVFAGTIVMARRRRHLMLLYVALSLAAVCSTPFQKQFVRYLLPLYPFLALALFEAAMLLGAKSSALLSPKRGALAVTLPWLMVCVIGLREMVELHDLYGERHDHVSYQDQNGLATNYRLFYYAPLGAAFDEALDWLRTLPARPNAVVAATDPQWVYLRTGMKAVLPPFEINGAKAQQLVDTVPVEYLIVEKRSARLGLGAYQRFTSALLRENPAGWGQVWSSADGSVEIYQRKASARDLGRTPS